MTTKPKPLAARRTSVGARRSPEAEEAVLAAAKGLLGEKGYAGFSIDEVARRAGAGKTTIYRWYPTKADLFIAIYSVERAAFVPVPDTGILLEDLVQYTASLWRFWASQPAGMALRGLIAEAQGSQDALYALRERFLPERTADVRKMFTDSAARGEISAGDVSDKVSLWVGYSWMMLLINELHREDALPSIVRQIAGISQSGHY
ncbi:TetR/AcrR family transcriptional regulator [Rhizobium tumorigenes]|uniref:TetR/AcrR family transcriptional regulator n=1 Tax=Rhizobium tumorigenes TaxID=2041385 RepID=UPI00241D7F18|nr:TetR/AcrR family transcriptional regulator [Rhizobium tumorigenes]WFS03612.1 TetR/AcrR family transcriptional regulator [Rhizobium tumorigenes]